MSGVYVKDWEAPYCCAVCPFEDFDNERLRYICTAGWADIDERDHRHPNCPLIPVPPHGRLIDADAIRTDIDEKRPGRSYEDAWALTVMDAAPTVLEAEEGE